MKRRERYRGSEGEREIKSEREDGIGKFEPRTEIGKFEPRTETLLSPLERFESTFQQTQATRGRGCIAYKKPDPTVGIFMPRALRNSSRGVGQDTGHVGITGVPRP